MHVAAAGVEAIQMPFGSGLAPLNGCTDQRCALIETFHVSTEICGAIERHSSSRVDVN
jgi:hypothetical protein